MPNTDYRWYGACAVGDAQARRRWSAAIGADRLFEISQLRQEVSSLSGPYIQRLIDLKGAQQQARPVSRQIQAVVDEFMREMMRLLQSRKAVLDELHLPLRAVLELVRVAIDRFVEQGLTEPEWEVPDEVLTQFPDDIRSYFRPRHAGDSPEKLDQPGGETA